MDLSIQPRYYQNIRGKRSIALGRNANRRSYNPGHRSWVVHNGNKFVSESSRSVCTLIMTHRFHVRTRTSRQMHAKSVEEQDRQQEGTFDSLARDCLWRVILESRDLFKVEKNRPPHDSAVFCSTSGTPHQRNVPKSG